MIFCRTRRWHLPSRIADHRISWLYCKWSCPLAPLYFEFAEKHQFPVKIRPYNPISPNFFAKIIPFSMLETFTFLWKINILSDFHIDFSTKNIIVPSYFVQFSPKFDSFRPLNFLRKFTWSSQFSPKLNVVTCSQNNKS